MPEPIRGEVWLAELDPVGAVVGHEQAGRRPVLVISGNRYNFGKSGMIIAVPVTKRLRSDPLHVVVHPPEGRLRVESSILCDQVRSISKLRLLQRLGMMTVATMGQVEDRLRPLLGL